MYVLVLFLLYVRKRTRRQAGQLPASTIQVRKAFMLLEREKYALGSLLDQLRLDQNG